MASIEIPDFKIIKLNDGTWAQAIVPVDADGNPVGGGGGGAVSSVFTRTGAVVAAIGDYTKEQITGLKTTDSPTFAGANLASDTDTAVNIGRGKIWAPVTDEAAFSHIDRTSPIDFAIKQTQGGETTLNSRAGSGRVLKFAIGNNVKATIGIEGYLLNAGCFASIYSSNNSTAQTIATGASYVKVVNFASNGHASNATADQTNNKNNAHTNRHI